MVWKADAPQGNEQRKTRWRTIPYCRGKGLDLGAGPEKVMDTVHVISVDSCKDTQLFGIQMRPDIVADVTDLKMFGTESMDFIFSSHFLEHCPYDDVPAILRGWFRVLRVGGHLCLYLPEASLYPNIGSPGANVDHKWDPTYDLLVAAAEKACPAWDLVEYELCDKADEYSLWAVFKKLKWN